MSKLFIVVVVLVIGALILGGALEIKFHPDQLSQVPARVLSYGEKWGVSEKIESWKKSAYQLVFDRYMNKTAKEDESEEIEQTDDEGIVAGSKDESAEPNASPTIPLQF